MGGTAPLEQLEPTGGRLLVASPRLLDPNFMHSVVLLVAHESEGSYGLILNRRADLTVADLGSEEPLLAGRRDPVWIGGPVAAQQLQVLHGGADVPGALSVLPGVQLGGDPVVLRSALAGDRPEVKFVVGYSGWSEGQLATELGEGSWIVCPGDARLVFDPRPESLWRRVLRARGGAVAGLADLPPDPSWN